MMLSQQSRPRINPRNQVKEKSNSSLRITPRHLIEEKTKTDTNPPPKKKRRGNPNWKKGKSGNPNGKPKGVYHKFALAQYRQELATGQQLPLAFMLSLMRNQKEDMQLRLSAATAAAPYLHKRQPQGIEVTPGRYGSLTADQLRQLPTPALHQLLAASQTFYQQLVQLGVAQPAGEIIDVVPT